ncbi:hypothetical protein HHK36_009869 [Tetracentron sinense]|uniref:Transcription factor MYC/MYB N-terminal domain-containing protein n=1 Tax=Tetracentron sinense TaxID=13715 RepID=A0A835DM04_TETSI|nr:hypothetical protein HHK36_009869 [Tetracentron sinense]
MEGGLPMLNCLLQHTLRSLCSCSDSSNSSKWVYAVFWRILPRNYPPPKWDYGGGVLDRSKGNKRNWILVWEDGFCDFHECERTGSGYIKGRFGADVFFKMSHEVYNYGEGLVGKVAADNSHKWVFREITSEKDPNLISSWSGSIDPQPRAWEFQFNSGIQIVEDLNLVISIQRKFSYLHSIPGVFAMQRPYLPIQHPNTLKPNTQMIKNSNEMGFVVDDNRHVKGGKRCYGERLDDSPIKSMNLGWNSPQTAVGGGPFWSIPPLLPTMSCSLGALLSKLPSVIPSHDAIEALDNSTSSGQHYTNNSTSRRLKFNGDGLRQNQISDVKVEYCFVRASEEEKPKTQNLNSSLLDQVAVQLGIGAQREGECQGALNLN